MATDKNQLKNHLSEKQNEATEGQKTKTDTEKQENLAKKINIEATQIQNNLKTLESAGSKDALILYEKLALIQDNLTKLEDEVYTKNTNETEKELAEITAQADTIEISADALRYEKADQYLHAVNDPRHIKKAIDRYQKNNVVGTLEGRWFIEYFKADGKSINFEEQERAEALGGLPQYNEDGTPKTYQVTERDGRTRFLRFLPNKLGDKTAGGKFYWVGEPPLFSKPKPLHGSIIEEVKTEDANIEKELAKQEKNEPQTQEEIEMYQEIEKETATLISKNAENQSNKDKIIQEIVATTLQDIQQEKGSLTKKAEKTEITQAIKKNVQTPFMASPRITQTASQEKSELKQQKQTPIIKIFTENTKYLQDYITKQKNVQTPFMASSRITQIESQESITETPEQIMPFATENNLPEETKIETKQEGIVKKLFQMITDYLKTKDVQTPFMASQEKNENVGTIRESSKEPETKKQAEMALETLLGIFNQIKTQLPKSEVLSDNSETISGKSLLSETSESPNVFEELTRTLNKTKETYFNF